MKFLYQYSSGMDKKPCALGGGLAYIKKSLGQELPDFVEKTIKTYKQEYFPARILTLAKKIPTFLLLNVKPMIQ